MAKLGQPVTTGSLPILLYLSLRLGGFYRLTYIFSLTEAFLQITARAPLCLKNTTVTSFWHAEPWAASKQNEWCQAPHSLRLCISQKVAGFKMLFLNVTLWKSRNWFLKWSSIVGDRSIASRTTVSWSNMSQSLVPWTFVLSLLHPGYLWSNLFIINVQWRLT